MTTASRVFWACALLAFAPSSGAEEAGCSDPSFVDRAYEKGLLLYIEDKFTESLEAFEEAQDCEPGNVLVRNAIRRVAAVSEPPAKPRPRLYREGRALYELHRCSYCHSIGREGGSIGPRLDGAKGLSISRVRRHLNGAGRLKDSKMPALRLKPDDVNALAAYIVSIGGASKGSLKESRP